MRKKKVFLIFIVFFTIQFFYSATAQDTTQAENVGHPYGAPVFYPTNILGGVALAMYDVRAITTLFQSAGTGNVLWYIIPFGGVYHLTRLIERGVTTAQVIKMKRNNITQYKNRVLLQWTLNGLAFCAYGATTATGFSYSGNIFGAGSPMKILLPLTASLMTVSYVFDVISFKKYSDQIPKYHRLSPVTIQLSPVIKMVKNDKDTRTFGLCARISF